MERTYKEIKQNFTDKLDGISGIKGYYTIVDPVLYNENETSLVAFYLLDSFVISWRAQHIDTDKKCIVSMQFDVEGLSTMVSIEPVIEQFISFVKVEASKFGFKTFDI